MRNTLNYTITNNNPDDYATIQCNLQAPPTDLCKFIVTNLTTRCTIVVLEANDYIEINGEQFFIGNQYSDLGYAILCDVLSTVIAKSNVKVTTDSCLRLVFYTDEGSDFTITGASYNVKQITGLYNTKFPLASVDGIIRAPSIGYSLSTPILYLICTVGDSCYRTSTDNTNNMKTLMRINNSFSPNFPIIASNGEFSTLMNSNSLSNLTIQLVDANGVKIHLLSPMYISAIAQGVHIEEPPLLLSLPSPTTPSDDVPPAGKGAEDSQE